MINFKEVLEVPDVERRVITVDGVPVWDYKSANFNVYLIYDMPYKGVEEDYVTVGELKNYLTEVGIPQTKVVFFSESTRVKLTHTHISPELTVNFKT